MGARDDRSAQLAFCLERWQAGWPHCVAYRHQEGRSLGPLKLDGTGNSVATGQHSHFEEKDDLTNDPVDRKIKTNT